MALAPKGTLVVAAGVALLMLLVPPWESASQQYQTGSAKNLTTHFQPARFLGYSPVLFPIYYERVTSSLPELSKGPGWTWDDVYRKATVTKEQVPGRIAWRILGVEVAGLAVVTGVVFYLLGMGRSSKEGAV